jgi:hypothetical protein
MRLRRKYANGKLCGEIIDDIIVQFRLPNQLVLQKHHLSVFAYVLVASTDPLIVYYQDGYVEMKDANRSTFITLETFQQDLPVNRIPYKTETYQHPKQDDHGYRTVNCEDTISC